MSNNDKSNELSPCPCCGYRAAIEQVPHDPESDNSGSYYIECKRAGCGITTRLAFACKDDPLPGLIESWNRRALPSATAPTISGVKVAMRLKQQRDELADALRALLAVVENNFPMPAGVHAGSPMDLARKAIAQVPTYEQQLRNICDGVGIDYEQMFSRYVGVESDGSKPL